MELDLEEIYELIEGIVINSYKITENEIFEDLEIGGLEKENE